MEGEMTEFLIDTAIQPAPEDPPLTRARLYANAELRQQATPQEVAWLHANPCLWYQALSIFLKDVRRTIRESKVPLEQLKPGAGTGPSTEYLQAKREVEERNLPRRTFERIVEVRRSEVRSILGHIPPIDRIDVADWMSQLAEMIESGQHVEAARDARSYARRLISGRESAEDKGHAAAS
jgi:hypothetical protein